jgi:hypothetical protein
LGPFSCLDSGGLPKTPKFPSYKFGIIAYGDAGLRLKVRVITVFFYFASLSFLF